MNGRFLGFIGFCFKQVLSFTWWCLNHDLHFLLGTLAVVCALISFVRLPGCKGESSLKDYPRVLIRGDSAVIVVPETEDPKAKLYYVSCQNDKWDLRQTIDLTPYLDGWFCNLFSYSATFDRQGDEETNQVHAIAMNDRWLAIAVCE